MASQCEVVRVAPSGRCEVNRRLAVFPRATCPPFGLLNGFKAAPPIRWSFQMPRKMCRWRSAQASTRFPKLVMRSPDTTHNATPPSVETIGGAAGSRPERALTKSRVDISLCPRKGSLAKRPPSAAALNASAGLFSKIKATSSTGGSGCAASISATR
jgi:hypothetical protein